ncbi:MAG: hypothetical protein AAFY35_08590 [Pseudomonadota bacterium]
MTRVGSSLALAVLVAWGVQSLAMVALAPLAATLLGAAAGAAAVAALTRSMVVGGALALLAPFGVMLPALALGAMAARLGVDLPGFSAVELAVFLAGYTVFLLCAFGVIQVDLYRLGYAPGPVAGMVLGMCAYAGLTGHWGLAVVAVLGQVFWVMKWGSSNWFDYVLHLLLWPIAAVALVASAF